MPEDEGPNDELQTGPNGPGTPPPSGSTEGGPVSQTARLFNYPPAMELHALLVGLLPRTGFTSSPPLQTGTRKNGGGVVRAL